MKALTNMLPGDALTSVINSISNFSMKSTYMEIMEKLEAYNLEHEEFLTMEEFMSMYGYY